MIGVYGTIVIGKGSSKVAVGVIPNGNKTETYEVVNAEADRIVTTNGTLRPDRKTKLYISAIMPWASMKMYGRTCSPATR